MVYNPIKSMYNVMHDGLTKAYSATATGLEKLMETNRSIKGKTLDGLAKGYKAVGLEKLMKSGKKQKQSIRKF